MKNLCTAGALFGLAAIFGAGEIFAYNDAPWREIGESGVSVPVPPRGEHPRLYVRQADLPTLKKRLQDPRVKVLREKLEQLALPRTPEEEAQISDRGYRHYFEMRGLVSKVQLQALDYLVYGDEKAAREAIETFLVALRETHFGTEQDLSRASGIMLMCGAMIYDWCFDQMSPRERQSYVEEFVRIAKTMECGYPPKNDGALAGHLSEWMILRDLLSAGIAIYDEFPEMYEKTAELIFREYVPARNFFYGGLNLHQGTGYFSVRFSSDLLSLWIFDKMGAGMIYAPEQQFVLYDVLYRRRPDGLVLPSGDANPGRRGKISPRFTLSAFLASSYFRDPFLAYEFERSPHVENHCLIFEILWRDFDLRATPPDTLPLTRFSGTPFGSMIARTGWDENSVIAEMKINENFVGNHQHLDAGSFQIYYKGPLAIDSGAYQGADGGYNSAHNKNYFKRTIAHNSLLIFDPRERFACKNYGGKNKTDFAANDGGQRFPGEAWRTCRNLSELLSEEFSIGKTLAKDFGPDPQTPEFSYLKGDISTAYSAAKAREVKRSFVFLNLNDADGNAGGNVLKSSANAGNATTNAENATVARGNADKSSTQAAAGTPKIPAALIVFDKVVSTEPDFRKFWLLHCIEEPEIRPRERAFVVNRTRDGDSGRLYGVALLPEADALRLSKVGGNGKEFWVFGKNYPNAHTAERPDPANERGSWRIEISPAKPAREDLFLCVLQVADTSCENFHEVKMLETQLLPPSHEDEGTLFLQRSRRNEKSASVAAPPIAVALANRVVAFSRDGNAISQAFSLAVPADAKILLTDLSPGEWTISQDGKILEKKKVFYGKNTLYFSGAAGVYVFSKTAVPAEKETAPAKEVPPSE